MRLTFRKLTGLLIAFIILLDSCFLYLIKMPSRVAEFQTGTSKIVEGAFIIIIVILCCSNKRMRSIVHRYGKFLNKFVLIYILAIAFVAFATKIKYPEGSNWTNYMMIQYMLPLFAYVIILYLHYAGEQSLFDILNEFLILWYIVLIVQSWLYNTSGMIFMTNLQSNLLLREGNLRIGLGAFGNIMLLYNFYKVIYPTDKRKVLEIINLILGVYCMIAIQQTRMMTIIILAIFVYMIICQSNRINNLVKNVIIVALASIIIYNTGFLDNLFSTFTSADYEGSSIAREYAIAHFLGVFMENPLFGFGFASPGNYSTLVTGVQGIASVDDVGIIGQMARFGVFAFVILVPILIRMFKICYRLKRTNYIYSKIFLSFAIYTLLTCSTLCILDPQRLLLLPFLLGLFEYVNYQYGTRVEEVVECG